MDDNVLAAMKRWPNVPAVSGWLSLNSLGQWRLHPDGQACSPGPGGTLAEGETIGNPQLLAFLSRNYSHDDTGRWYVQNGPQRVYVRLDAAPFVLATCGDHAAPGLLTHTGLRVPSVLAWWLDSDGRLFAQTRLGAGLIAGRDTPEVLGRLRLDRPDGAELDGSHLEALMASPAASLTLHWPLQPGPNAAIAHQSGPLRYSQASQIPSTLGFVALPQV